MESLRQIYDQFHKEILAVSFHYAGNLEEAEEIVQEVFIRYSRNAEKLDKHINIKAWLLRVAINICFDNKRRMKTALKYIKNQLVGHIQEDKVELRDEIRELLNRVDKKTRMILILKYMEGMDFYEISEVMKMPVGSVKSIASRGIKRIKK